MDNLIEKIKYHIPLFFRWGMDMNSEDIRGIEYDETESLRTDTNLQRGLLSSDMYSLSFEDKMNAIIKSIEDEQIKNGNRLDELFELACNTALFLGVTNQEDGITKISVNSEELKHHPFDKFIGAFSSISNDEVKLSSLAYNTMSNDESIVILGKIDNYINTVRITSDEIEIIPIKKGEIEDYEFTGFNDEWIYGKKFEDIKELYSIDMSMDNDELDENIDTNSYEDQITDDYIKQKAPLKDLFRIAIEEYFGNNGTELHGEYYRFTIPDIDNIRNDDFKFFPDLMKFLTNLTKNENDILYTEDNFYYNNDNLENWTILERVYNNHVNKTYELIQITGSNDTILHVIINIAKKSFKISKDNGYDYIEDFENYEVRYRISSTDVFNDYFRDSSSKINKIIGNADTVSRLKSFNILSEVPGYLSPADESEDNVIVKYNRENNMRKNQDGTIYSIDANGFKYINGNTPYLGLLSWTMYRSFFLDTYSIMNGRMVRQSKIRMVSYKHYEVKELLSTGNELYIKLSIRPDCYILITGDLKYLNLSLERDSIEHILNTFNNISFVSYNNRHRREENAKQKINRLLNGNIELIDDGIYNGDLKPEFRRKLARNQSYNFGHNREYFRVDPSGWSYTNDQRLIDRRKVYRDHVKQLQMERERERKRMEIEYNTGSRRLTDR